MNIAPIFSIYRVIPVGPSYVVEDSGSLVKITPTLFIPYGFVYPTPPLPVSPPAELLSLDLPPASQSEAVREFALPLNSSLDVDKQAAVSSIDEETLQKKSPSEAPPHLSLQEIYKQKVKEVIDFCSGSASLKEKITRCETLVAELKAQEFSSYDPLSALRLTTGLLFDASITKLFFDSNQEGWWHELLFSLVPQNSSPTADAFCYELFTAAVEHLYESEQTISKEKLRIYHTHLHQLLRVCSLQNAQKQAALVHTLFRHLPALFRNYREYQLHEEACQLLQDLHLTRDILCEGKDTLVSCLLLLTDRARSHNNNLQAMFEIEQLLKQVRFLTIKPTDSNCEVVQQQAELCFLLATGFVKEHPMKSWQLFQGIIALYPKLLREARFVDAVTALIEERCETIGCPALILLMDTFKKETNSLIPFQWEPCFHVVIAYLLKKQRFQEVYQILKNGRGCISKKLLHTYVANWIDAFDPANQNPAQPLKSSQIFKIMRLYKIAQPDLWERLFVKAQGWTKIDLFKELQFAEQHGLLVTDSFAQKTCWKIVLKHAKETQLGTFLAYRKTLLTVFQRNTRFFIHFMNAILDHLEKITECKREFRISLRQLHEAVSKFPCKEQERLQLQIISIRVELLDEGGTSAPHLVEFTAAFLCLIKENSNAILCPFFLIYLKKVVEWMLQKEAERNELYAHLVSQFQALLSLLSQAAIPSLYLMKCLQELLPLLKLGFLYMNSYGICWTALCERANSESVETKQQVNYLGEKAAFFEFLRNELSLFNLMVNNFFYTTLINNKVLSVFSPSEQAMLGCIVASGSLMPDRTNPGTLSFVIHHYLPIILRAGSNESKSFFCTNLFNLYFSQDATNFFQQVDVAKSSLKKQRENAELELTCEKEFEKLAVLYSSFAVKMIPDQVVQRKLLEISTERFKQLVQLTQAPGNDLQLQSAFDNLFMMQTVLVDSDRFNRAKKFLDELDANYGFFPKEKEYQRCAYYLSLRDLDPKIEVPLETFSSEILCRILSEKIQILLAQKQIDVMLRVKHSLVILENFQKAMLDKVQKDFYRQEFQAVAESYKILFEFLNREAGQVGTALTLVDNADGTQSPLRKSVFIKLYELFTHIKKHFSHFSPTTQGGLADFVVQLSLDFFTSYQSEIRDSLDAFSKQNKVQKNGERTTAVQRRDYYLYISHLNFAESLVLFSEFIFLYAKHTQSSKDTQKSINEKMQQWMTLILSYPAAGKYSPAKYCENILKIAHKSEFTLSLTQGVNV